VTVSTCPKVNWRQPETSYALDPYAPRGSVRTVAGSNLAGFDVTVTRTVRDGRRLVRRDTFTSVRLRRPDPHLRPGLEHPRVVLRAAARLGWGAVDRQCGRLGLPAMPGSEGAAACFAAGRRAEATVA
jgi:hypothetical protein